MAQRDHRCLPHTHQGLAQLQPPQRDFTRLYPPPPEAIGESIWPVIHSTQHPQELSDAIGHAGFCLWQNPARPR